MLAFPFLGVCCDDAVLPLNELFRHLKHGVKISALVTLKYKKMSQQFTKRASSVFVGWPKWSLTPPTPSLLNGKISYCRNINVIMYDLYIFMVCIKVNFYCDVWAEKI